MLLMEKADISSYLQVSLDAPFFFHASISPAAEPIEILVSLCKVL